MPRKFEYTTLAHRYTARFPLITYVGTQVNFWILANILLVVIVHLYGRIISEMHAIPMDGELGTFVLVASIMGLVYGLGLGLTTYYLEQKVFRKLSSGKVLLYKTLISLGLLLLVLTFLRLVLFDVFISPMFNMAGVSFSDRSWDHLFQLFLIYYFFMTLVISFINQVNKKYGPGVLVPLLLGRYRTPQEEERIFMFMDLKSSTLTAERLGHLKYSAFIRDCFADINEVLYPFCAQVYQYVGDEIVITWPETEGLRNSFCIRFYFAVKAKFDERASYYQSNYGLLPMFKAGLHMGKVTAVEIGEVKKDIAYHGDTLNTAARIQSVCNQFQKDFLASEHLINKVAAQSSLKTEHLGSVLLRGKAERVGIVSVLEVY
ncbi:MAG TPA: adenylate/guanylate cyclase domain-containing protein [Chryseosolibacter sp.]